MSRSIIVKFVIAVSFLAAPLSQACSINYGTFACGFLSGNYGSSEYSGICIEGTTVKNGILNINQFSVYKDRPSVSTGSIVTKTYIDQNSDSKKFLNLDFLTSKILSANVMKFEYVSYQTLELPENWESISDFVEFDATYYFTDVKFANQTPKKPEMNKINFKMSKYSCNRK